MKPVLMVSFVMLIFSSLAVGCVDVSTGEPAQEFTPITETTLEPKQTNPAPVEVEDIEIDPTSLKGVQITFIHPWTGETEREVYQMVDQFNQFNEWGIHVVLNAPGSAGQVTQQIDVGLLNQEYYNVITMPGSQLLALDIKSQQITNLEPYVRSLKYGLTGSEIADFDLVFWREDLVNGKRVGIPAQRTAAILFYNATWADELGYSELPATQDEFKEQVCSANASKRKDPDPTDDGTGGWLVNHEAMTMVSWLSSFDAGFFDNGRFNFSSDQAEVTFNFLLDLSERSCAWKGRNPAPYEYFAKRQVLAYSGVFQDILMQEAASKRIESADEWILIPYPGKDGPVVTTGGNSYGIMHTNPQEDLAAWLFIRWMSAPAQQARLLQTTATLPLGTGVMDLTAEFARQHPQWGKAVESLGERYALPVDADWIAISPILEDAGWQLFKTGMKKDQIPDLLSQMDELTTELSGRTP